MVGDDKVALGTGYSFPLGELEPMQLIDGMSYEKKTKEQLLSRSALELFGMKKEDFI